MVDLKEMITTRKNIGIRFLYTMVFLFIFEILKTIIQFIVFFQFIYLFITQDYNNPVRTFSNKVIAYAYKVMRYLTLNENMRPFPFNDFPYEIEVPDEDVSFK